MRIGISALVSIDELAGKVLFWIVRSWLKSREQMDGFLAGPRHRLSAMLDSDA